MSMRSDIWVVLLAGSASLIVYSYVLYPVLLRIGAWVVGRKGPISARPECPRVSLVVAAHNEDVVIGEKLRNTMQLRYPKERLEVLVGSDESTDRTDEICRSHAWVTFKRLEPRRGKATVLNTLIPKALGDIVVLSDANTMIDPGAIESMVRHFSDPSVGGVCGRLILESDGDTLEGAERFYWQYENSIKELESRLYSTFGANGGLYAIRKELFVTIPPDTIVDDFEISLHLLEQGKRLVFEPEAVAHEAVSKSFRDLFWRKVRIGAGNLQTLRRRMSFFLKAPLFVSFAYVSRKFIRGIIPFLLIACWVCSLALLDRHPFGLTFWAFNLSLVLALVGLLKVSSNRLIVGLAYLYSLNFALLVGYGRYMFGLQNGTWQRAER